MKVSTPQSNKLSILILITSIGLLTINDLFNPNEAASRYDGHVPLLYYFFMGFQLIGFVLF